MKQKKRFSILSVVFTAVASVCFLFLALDWIYILTLEKGLASVIVAFGVFLMAASQAVLLLVFGSLGGVFAGLALKKQEAKRLNITTLVVSAALVTITITIFVAFFVFAALLS